MLFDRMSIEALLPSGSSAEVAHYTKIGSLCYFLRDISDSKPPVSPGWNSAWATPVQFLNDRLELALGLEIFQRIATSMSVSAHITNTIDQLSTDFGSLETDAFQMSFSGNPDELGQWRGYAANGMGCAVVTDATAVRGVADIAGWVLYEEKQQEAFVEAALNALSVLVGSNPKKSISVIAQFLTAATSFIKHPGFHPEQEFRLLKFPGSRDVKFRETGDRLVPYIDYLSPGTPLPVKRIVIGPGWQLSRLSDSDLPRHHVVQGIQRLLSVRGLTTTGIARSEIPYDPK
jgi:hypothetical protein